MIFDASCRRRVPERIRTCFRATLRPAHLALLVLCWSWAAAPQQTPGPAATQQNPGTIRTESNLVLVRVIVRDAHGTPVTGLSKNDFKLLDNRKQQVISYFSTQPPGSGIEATTRPGTEKQPSEPTTSTAVPRAFAAIFFDDYHISFGNLVQVREAARRYLRKNLDAGARVAIFSASGRPDVEFTSDPERIDNGLSQLNFNRRFEPAECPRLPPYFAQLVLDAVGGAEGVPRSSGSADPSDLDTPLKLAEVIAAQQHCPVSSALPDEDIQSRARNLVTENDLGVQETLRVLNNLVQRLAETPGDWRTIAMVSDGFFDRNLQYKMDKLINRALRANVIVSTLDTRGLYAEAPGGELWEVALPPEIQTRIDQVKHTGAQIDSDPLNEVAQATGGVFIQNTNDMEIGLARISGLNAASYLLGFSPENVKLDGRFHSLQVKVSGGSHFTVQARRGYVAAENTGDSAATQEERMSQAVFSQESLNGFALKVSTGMSKADGGGEKLSVVVDVDMKAAQFVKQAGRNIDDMTVLVVVFDQDGNYVTARRQTIKLRLPDQAFQELRRSGGETTVDLTLKPGTYVVRAVVGDSNSDQLGAVSKGVTVP
ncbi:MAG TPA: VWA domain-containing protein [Candidatus Acidoferrum sp.]|nr:VWA domain-containing protein [Candidatus Acidoferrum sp.]